MIQKYCPECGTKMIEKELEKEGFVPFCPSCNQFRFPMYNVACSMIVISEETGKILLIKQYDKPFNILVAGYCNRGEQLEDCARREIKEETNMTVDFIKFNHSKFYEPSNTLMCNFLAYVKDDKELIPNDEVDSYQWFTKEEALEEIKRGSTAEWFLRYFLGVLNESV